jgi:N utilization substance protein B
MTRAGARPAARKPRKANKRGAARLAAVQALYQMDLAGTGLNEILAEFQSHWLGGDVETVLRAVLRAGAYELACRGDVPARVVTSEYVDVASAFVDAEETGMVNAVLDHLARQLRAGEFTSASPSAGGGGGG